MGAPKGNQNAVKVKPWQAAIERALAKRSLLAKREAIDDLAERLLQKCEEGDLSALKEFGDRIEGRPAQSMTLGSDPNNPINITVSFHDPE